MLVFLDKNICPSLYTSSLFPAKQRHDEDPYFRAEEEGQGKINPGLSPRRHQTKKIWGGSGYFRPTTWVLTYFAGERSCCGDLEPLGFDEDHHVSPRWRIGLYSISENWITAAPQYLEGKSWDEIQINFLAPRLAPHFRHMFWQQPRKKRLFFSTQGSSG